MAWQRQLKFWTHPGGAATVPQLLGKIPAIAEKSQVTQGLSFFFGQMKVVAFVTRDSRKIKTNKPIFLYFKPVQTGIVFSNQNKKHCRFNGNASDFDRPHALKVPRGPEQYKAADHIF
jgi:hypothetical protein